MVGRRSLFRREGPGKQVYLSDGQVQEAARCFSIRGCVRARLAGYGEATIAKLSSCMMRLNTGEVSQTDLPL